MPLPTADDHDPYNTADSWRMKKLALSSAESEAPPERPHDAKRGEP